MKGFCYILDKNRSLGKKKRNKVAGFDMEENSYIIAYLT